MSRDRSGQNLPEEPEKEPWQVVGCPTCRAPPGMRCTSSRMTTHSPRRRAFNERMEAEREEKARSQTGSGAAGTRKPYRGRDRARSDQANPDAPTDSGARQSRYPRYNSRDRKGQGSNEPEDTQEPRPVEKPVQEDWSALAARMRADRLVTPSPPSPPMPPSPALTAAAVMADAVPVPSPTPALAAPFRFTVSTKREDPATWQKTACPQCRMPAGTRCLAALGETRFASHDARLKAHLQSSGLG